MTLQSEVRIKRGPVHTEKYYYKEIVTKSLTVTDMTTVLFRFESKDGVKLTNIVGPKCRRTKVEPFDIPSQ